MAFPENRGHAFFVLPQIARQAQEQMVEAKNETYTSSKLATSHENANAMCNLSGFLLSNKINGSDVSRFLKFKCLGDFVFLTKINDLDCSSLITNISESNFCSS